MAAIIFVAAVPYGLGQTLVRRLDLEPDEGDPIMTDGSSVHPHPRKAAP